MDNFIAYEFVCVRGYGCVSVECSGSVGDESIVLIMVMFVCEREGVGRIGVLCLRNKLCAWERILDGAWTVVRVALKVVSLWGYLSVQRHPYGDAFACGDKNPSQHMLKMLKDVLPDFI